MDTLKPITEEQYERLLAYITNPPPGSKCAAARDFGVDLTLTLGRLRLTPEERARDMQNCLQFIEKLRTQMESNK